VALPEIDIVIPFHKIDSALIECIKSCKSSIGIQGKVICVNDSGIDVSIFDLGLGENDKLVSTQGREGYKTALALGVINSTSDFVGFLDSDDLTSPNRFAIQINAMIQQNADLSTCEISKIDSTGRPVSPLLEFPKPPKSPDEKISLLFGAFGADSTMVCKGSILRETWSSHGRFPPHFADYGWFLSECSSIKIIHLANTEYFYRMHSEQMSRKVDSGEYWPIIFPYWQKWLEDLESVIPKTSSLIVNPQVALAIAFPSSLVKLTHIEKKQLRDFSSVFLSEMKVYAPQSFQSWKRVVDFRLFIGTKQIKYMSIAVVIRIITRLLLTIRNGSKFRIIKND
jgi:glycosyltransferase involved in cell wall biosynthesis